MHLLSLLLWLALVWPPGPAPAACGPPDAPYYVISLGDNPQWLPCPSDAPPATPPPSPAPVDYPVRVWMPVISR